MQSYLSNVQVISDEAFAGAAVKVGQATTLMFCHYPRKHSAQDLAATVEQHVPRCFFDFVYVPWDRNSNSNMGYGFVNFVDVPTACSVCALMEGMVWPNDTRRRQMKLAPARVQGLAANLMRYASAGITPDFTHCPMIFKNGLEVPLSVAVQNLNVQMGDPMPAALNPQQPCAPPPWTAGSQQIDYTSKYDGNGLASWYQARASAQLPLTSGGQQLMVKAPSQANHGEEHIGNVPGYPTGRLDASCFGSGSMTAPTGKVLGCPAGDLDASGFASSSTTASSSDRTAMKEWLTCQERDAVMRSPAYRKAWNQVNVLLESLQEAGAI